MYFSYIALFLSLSLQTDTLVPPTSSSDYDSSDDCNSSSGEDSHPAPLYPYATEQLAPQSHITPVLSITYISVVAAVDVYDSDLCDSLTSRVITPFEV